MALLEVEGLKKHYVSSGGLLRRREETVKAVDGVSFEIEENETFALVGESGCGKSTTGRLLLRLVEPTAGAVRFRSNDIYSLSRSEMREMRRDMQMIFQDPFASLNPHKSVRYILGRPFELFEGLGGPEVTERVIKLLELVGLSPAETYLDRNPHEFSGGQRQRIGIARAMALRPKFIVADEPVSSLDMSARCQIINLMKDLQRELGLTYMFISHDLAVVRSLATTVAVMYLGKIVESGPTAEIFENPMHPYTKALLSAVPIADPGVSRSSHRIILNGDPPSARNPPAACSFHTRCPWAQPLCSSDRPELRSVSTGHWVSCHRAESLFGMVPQPLARPVAADPVSA